MCLISESDLFSYNGKFRVINRVYTNKLTDKSSSAYKNMSAEVTATVCVQENIVQNKITMLTIDMKHIGVLLHCLQVLHCLISFDNKRLGLSDIHSFQYIIGH